MVLTTLPFGNRAASWIALGLFAVLFGGLGWAVTREILRRSSTASRGLARFVGLVLFAVPVFLLYVSSLNGFYEAEVEGRVLRMRYLLPALVSELPLSEVASARPVPWYRGRWRLEIVDTSGKRYTSATANRESVSESEALIRQALDRTGP
jgi:hypothetical protein